MAGRFLKCRFLLVLLISVLCCLVMVILRVRLNTHYFPEDIRERLIRSMNSRLKSKDDFNTAFEGLACRVPSPDVDAPEILALLQDPPEVKCPGRDWVSINGSTAYIENWAKKEFGLIQCTFTDIIRQNDHQQYAGTSTKTHTEYNLEFSDVVKVYCISESKVTWEKVLIGIRSDQDLFDRSGWDKLAVDSIRLNVLMFGFDSLSRNMWKRKLPKTYKYVTNDLKGIVLKGYNILGDGTPQALIPMLTGKTELELPDTRKSVGSRASFVDVYPFVWNDFVKNGYVTAWSEDMVSVGTFTFRLKGFKEQPVDHYMRTFYSEVSPNFKSEKRLCYGGRSRFQIFISFVKNVYEVYKERPKFTFAFHSEYSHDDNNLAGLADNETYEWLQEFNAKNYFNNTLLIMMSDHGSRYEKFRQTQQGKLEERLPAFIFVFPPWFSQKYSEAYKNFIKNSERLTTPFDIYETFKNIIHFEGAGMGNLQNRGISLFQEIPSSRTCIDAGVEPHWCTCLNWEAVPNDNPIVIEAVSHFVNALNSYTSKHRDLCAKLKLDKIFWSAKLIPNKKFLKFRRTIDSMGFEEELTADTKILLIFYQFKVNVVPGNMTFEASVRYYTDTNKFVVMESEISRLNKYKNMTHCIEDHDKLHHLRKYCYCL